MWMLVFSGVIVWSRSWGKLSGISSISTYESSRFALETSAAIHLAPNVNGLLRRYSLFPESFGATDGSTVFLHDLRPLRKVYPYPWQLVHRIDLHNALKEKARSLGVEIKLQSRVKGIDCEKTSLILESGEVVKGDFVIGADGVHGRSSDLLLTVSLRNAVFGYDTFSEPSETSAFRFLIPTSEIKADPITAHFAERPGELAMVHGHERRLVMYPCRDNTELNFIEMIPDYESGATEGDWNQTGSKEVLLKFFDGFSDGTKALLEKAPPDAVKLWQLLDHEALPNVKNASLIGDAAHSFLPHQGQGGAQAMEDGAALAALLPLGTLPSEIPSRLKLYTTAQHERAIVIQNYSRDSAFPIKGKTDLLKTEVKGK
ncbi:FAD/NAD(P)-binding domain-containing protein [Acephala macrosclerotiorum]|nr:FAD/NAD(P)-binding domain-containing protein [Acephala macrosclerotiorum]